MDIASPPNPPHNEIENRVEREIAAIPISGKQRQIAPSDLDSTAPETRLVLLMDAVTGEAPIPDEETFKALYCEWFLIFALRGGLLWEYWNQYARNCRQVDEAAKRHRKFIEGLKK